jgi:hypothetical protein
LDGTLDAWPSEPPRPPRTPADRARRALIDSPGVVHRLAWTFSDVGRASTLASSFRRAKPFKLDPAATGTFDARVFFDPQVRKWPVLVSAPLNVFRFRVRRRARRADR